MKPKALAIALCMILTYAPVKAANNGGDGFFGDGLNQGQVVAIDASSLTIAVGSPIEMGEGSPMDFNGEQLTVYLNENTLYLSDDLYEGEGEKEKSQSILESLNALLKVFSWGEESEPEQSVPPQEPAPGSEVLPGEGLPGEGQAGEQAANLLPGGYESLHVGDYVSIEMDESQNARVVTKLDPGKGMEEEPEKEASALEKEKEGEVSPLGSGNQGGVDSYESVLTFTEDTQLENQDIVSNSADGNAVLVQGGARVTLKGVHISRENKESTGGEQSTCFGVGAATLATDGILTLDSCIIRTDSEGSTAAFAYEEGEVEVKESTLHTDGGSSSALAVAGGGTLAAIDVVATTEGKSSPAVSLERGGGTITIEGGSYTALSVDSPAILCKGELVGKDAALVATATEAVRLEGTGSISLTDCYLYGKGSSLEEEKEEAAAVLLYRRIPMDSDSEEKSVFEMTGGTLESGNGGLFYATNTSCEIALSGVDLISSEDSPFFLCCMGGKWGTSGTNGAICTLTTENQTIAGDILWDELSGLTITLGENSELTGQILQEESEGDSEKRGTCRLTLKSGSTWIVTGDSTLTSLSLKGGTLVDEEGRTVTVAREDRTILMEGDSNLVVTVETLES